MQAPKRGKAQNRENGGERKLLAVAGDKDQSDQKPAQYRAQKRSATANLTLA